ncbi:drebrin-like protein A isoform X2 [Anolis carolinensis]|uniref:drebrin-like protein A isoform X2 n=1 Tax=Anolis carolinensis TaxID=28377 RepID=UPI002F2B623B
MGSGGVDLEQHRLALMAAKGDVVGGGAAASWALFTYEKANVLKLLDSGAGGPDELAKRFQSGAVMYGLCRLPDGNTGQQHVVLISWVGERVSDQRRQACAGHLPAIRTFFKEATLVLKASQAEEVTQDGLAQRLSRAAPSSGTSSKKGPLGDPEEQVGTNYKKTNPALEILSTKRSSFWAQAEREEEERREEERRRAREERRRWERERMEEERRQAAERERRIQEKEQLIQEQRKLQAEKEAEERRSEEARRQQREQAKAPPETGLQKHTHDKEAATTREGPALSPQHTHSPRGFFRQRERSGSASERPSSPGSQPGVPRRPFLRYQRSLTESAYIFQRPDPLRSPSSPLGGFLPSGSPHGATPTPRQSKPPPPPISPKPGPGALSPLPDPKGRTPPIPNARTSSGHAAATTSPLAEPSLQDLTLSGSPGGGPTSTPSPELGLPSPCRAGDPPSPGPSLSDPPQAGPLGACPEETLPHIKSTDPSPRSPGCCGGPSQAEEEGGQSMCCSATLPPTNGFLQEEGLARDETPALAPSQAELAPSSQKGMGSMEEEVKCPKSLGLDMGGQVDSPAGVNLPGTGLVAGEGTRNGVRSSSVEGTEHDMDPKWQAAEA